MGIFTRKTRRPATETVTVEVDEDGARRTYLGETTHRVRWADLQRVAIRTTSDGPAAEDVFWVLVGDRTTGFVVPSSLASEDFLACLQQLPGFDNRAAVRAMQSIDDAVFECWRRPA